MQSNSQTSEQFQAKDVPISEVVDCLSGNSGLTEEEIYQKILLEGERYLVLSSSTKEETKLGEIPSCNIGAEPLSVFENKEGILVIRNGKAGTTFFLEKGKYAITDHAYILSLKDSGPYQMHLKWLMYALKSRFLEYSSSSDNGTWNMTGFFENVKFDVPLFERQMQIVRAYEKLEELRKKTIAIRDMINDAESKPLANTYVSFQTKDVPISEVVDCLSGNSGLTEEYLYSQIQSDSEKKYRILSASTDLESSQYIHRCKHPWDSTRLIAVVERKAVIRVVRIGKAGSVTYFAVGNYTITDNAYLLYLKDDLKYDVNLKWLMYALIPQFNEYANIAEYGTWNKTSFFENVRIDIPSYSEQLVVANAYERLEALKKRVKNIHSEIEELLTKQITQD